MRRRDFVALLGGLAVWPELAAAQTTKRPTIGFLSSASFSASKHLVSEFLAGLAEAGYDDQKVAIDYRWADGQYDRLPILAQELVVRRVQLIATAGGAVSAVAVSKATSTIPIVSLMGSDPVKLGLTTSISRPDKNVTGVSQLLADSEGKRLEILHELVPGAKTIGYLANPANARFDEQRTILEQRASGYGARVRVLAVTTRADIDAAFASADAEGINAIMVAADPFLFINVEQIVELVARHSLPAVYFVRR